MVHHQAHTLRMSILVESLDIEIRIRGDEVEHVPLPHVCPVFPTFVPSLYEHLVDAIGSSEVDIAAHILVVGEVATVRLCL